VGFAAPVRYGVDMESDHERPGTPPSEADGAAARRKPNLMKWTLAGLPEMELFENAAQRDAALHSIASEAGNPRAASWWIGLAILAVSMAAAFILLRLASRLVNWPGIIEESIRITGMFVCAAVMVRWLHRSGARKDLREKLLAAGIPVCRACGYSLRGHASDADRCPECGRTIDADARRILAQPRQSKNAATPTDPRAAVMHPPP
jgi:hypothetical protein